MRDTDTALAQLRHTEQQAYIMITTPCAVNPGRVLRHEPKNWRVYCSLRTVVAHTVL